MKIASSEEIKITHIPLVIKSIYSLLYEDPNNKEVLFICRNKEVSKKAIKEITRVSKFITMLGCNLDDSEEVYQYVLEETGLSLFTSTNIDEILGRYSIIINLDEDFKLESSKIKKNAIVFDLNRKSNLQHEKNNNSRIYKIKDFGFDLNELKINNNEWLSPRVDMELYNLINGERPGKVKYLYIENNWYSIKDYLNSFVKLKGKL